MAMVTDIMATDMVKVIMVINESNMKIKTYVINLKDSVDRRKAILAETAKYPFMDVELVEAVDGRKLKQEEIKACFDLKKFVNHYYRTPKGGEIGCTLSHRICYRKLLESEEEFALVLEDDVCLGIMIYIIRRNIVRWVNLLFIKFIEHTELVAIWSIVRLRNVCCRTVLL